MHLVIFEDSRWPRFAPLSLSRPLFSLATGNSTLLDKQIRALRPSRVTLWVRPELVNHCKRHILPALNLPCSVNVPLDAQPATLLNATSLLSSNVELPSDKSVAVVGDQIASAYVIAPGLSAADPLGRTAAWNKLLDLPPAPPVGRLAAYLWDLITWNIQSLIDDAPPLPPRIAPKAAGPYHLVNHPQIHLGQDVQIGPGCVLDATHGPIFIGDRAILGANAVFLGPCSIGAATQITPLALIRAGTTLGAQCKIGGEVSNTLFLSCSNKPHEGFVGDSYIGQWANLGAGTTTSNLKNTYGPVSLRQSQTPIPTGKQFLGSLIGDHSKFAVCTRLMTGSYIGYCCMVAASRLTPTHLPSFTFLTDKGPEPYNAAKAKEMMTTVMKRRHRDWEPVDDEILAYAARAAVEVEAGVMSE